MPIRKQKGGVSAHRYSTLADEIRDIFVGFEESDSFDNKKILLDNLFTIVYEYRRILNDYPRVSISIYNKLIEAYNNPYYREVYYRHIDLYNYIISLGPEHYSIPAEQDMSTSYQYYDGDDW